jgi:hypothetical protein
MRIMKLTLLSIPLLLFSNARAQDPDTTTFLIKEYQTEEQREEMQIEEQREEERLDSFGDDTYNQNVDPKSLEVAEDEEVLEILE